VLRSPYRMDAPTDTTDRQTDRQTNEQTNGHVSLSICLFVRLCQMESVTMGTIIVIAYYVYYAKRQPIVYIKNIKSTSIQYKYKST